MSQTSISEKDIKTRVEFLVSARCNHTQHMYIDITDDLIQGTLLARILYWFAETKDHKSKVRIFKDGFFWIAKQRKDWWEEIRITERQYDKAIKGLKEKGFVVLAKYKFNSMPTIHIRPNYEEINSATEKWKAKLREEVIAEYEEELKKEEIGNDTKCKSQGNDIKCNSGVTQDETLLTMITNNDYSNNDYRTDKYAFSEDKSSSKVSNIYAFSPEEKEVCGTQKQNRFISADYSYKELREHIRPVYESVLKDVYGCTADDTPIEDMLDITEGFYRLYKQEIGIKHRVLSDKAYMNLVDAFMNPPEIMDNTDYVFDYKSHMDMAKLYFKTDYNKQKKFKGTIEKSISHFMTDMVRSNLFYRACYYWGEE